MAAEKPAHADPIELTRQLLKISSISGEETEIARFMGRVLESLNYRVELQEVAAGRMNVIATSGKNPQVFFSTHLDTVPPPMPPGEDEDYLYGRGACDAKGILAAQIAAAEQLRAEGETNLGFLLLVDEEVGSIGARAANQHALASSCQYLINGEPTDNKLAIASKGSVRAKLRAEGRASHSAYPEQGESAIEKLLDVLARLREIRWPRDEFLGETTCNIGVIGGGTRTNVIPFEAYADVQIRLVADSEPVKQLLQQAAEGLARLEVLSIVEPVRLMAVEGFEECIVRFTTDIPHLKNWGTPLLLGPGSILEAHSAHERILKTEITRAVGLYAKLARLLLGRARASERNEDRTVARP
ncbi:MAG: M20/M25/M40 family metallo-hydrolase [Acidobacteriia bacterium]|nr:M20/M25/M40 family metallo-hydrolase [Terriglobia bacterium]